MLVDEESGSNILFTNYFKHIKLLDNHIYKESRNIYGFDEHKSYPIKHVSLDITLIRKLLIVDFLLMIYKSPYNTNLRRDWMILMEVISYAQFKCIKFTHNGKLAKVCSNKWQAHSKNKELIEDSGLSEVKGKIVLPVIVLA